MDSQNITKLANREFNHEQTGIQLPLPKRYTTTSDVASKEELLQMLSINVDEPNHQELPMGFLQMVPDQPPEGNGLLPDARQQQPPQQAATTAPKSEEEFHPPKLQNMTTTTNSSDPTSTNSTDFEEHRFSDFQRLDSLEKDEEGRIQPYVDFGDFYTALECANSNGVPVENILS